MDNDTVPFFITAEVLLKKKKFSPSNKYFTSPEVVKETVIALKKDGFLVSNIFKTSLTIFSSTVLFENTFGVTCTVSEAGLTTDKGRFFLVEKKYSGQIERIVLPRPLVPMDQIYTGSSSPDTGLVLSKNNRLKTNYIPEEFPAMLGAEPGLLKELDYGSGVKIAVIDSGFYRHKYLDHLDQSIGYERPKGNRIKINEDGFEKYKSFYEKLVLEKCKGVTRLYLANIKEKKKVITTLISMNIFSEEIMNKLKGIKDYLEFNSELGEARRNVEAQINNEIKQPDSRILFESQSIHGTNVIFSLFPMALKAKIELIRLSTYANGDFKDKKTIELCENFDIINNSNGNDIFRKPETNYDFNKDTDYIFKKGRIIELEMASQKNNNILIYVAGNARRLPEEETQAGKTLMESSMFYPGILVGGCYKTNKTLKASTASLGYYLGDLKVPHICGLNGMLNSKRNKIDFKTALCLPRPINEKNLLVENTDGWTLTMGTSFSAPQIAGVCALLRKACPGVRMEELKEILMVTANELEEGDSFFNGIPVGALKNRFNKNPGLVNIARAVAEAMRLNERNIEALMLVYG